MSCELKPFASFLWAVTSNPSIKKRSDKAIRAAFGVTAAQLKAFRDRDAAKILNLLTKESNPGSKGEWVYMAKGSPGNTTKIVSTCVAWSNC